MFDHIMLPHDLTYQECKTASQIISIFLLVTGIIVVILVLAVAKFCKCQLNRESTDIPIDSPYA